MQEYYSSLSGDRELPMERNIHIILYQYTHSAERIIGTG